MALQKSEDKELRKKKKKSSKEKSAKSKTKKAKKERGSRGDSRKAFILSTIKAAGSKGISKDDIVKMTDKKYNYEEGKTSRLRVGNTIREAVEAGQVAVGKDGSVTWKKG